MCKIKTNKQAEDLGSKKSASKTFGWHSEPEFTFLGILDRIYPEIIKMVAYKRSTKFGHILSLMPIHTDCLFHFCRLDTHAQSRNV